MAIISENSDFEDLLIALLFLVLAIILGLHYKWEAADYISLAAIYAVFYLHVRTTRANKIRFKEIDEKASERERIEDERYVSEQRNNLIDLISTLLSTSDNINLRISYLLAEHKATMNVNSITLWSDTLIRTRDHAKEAESIAKEYSDLSKPKDINEIHHVRKNIVGSIASARTVATALDEEFRLYSKGD